MNPLEQKITVRFPDEREVQVHPGTRVYELIEACEGCGARQPLAALVNHELVTLAYPLDVDSSVRILSFSDPHGKRVYTDSLAFLLAMAAQACYPEKKLVIEHSLGNAYFCTMTSVLSADELEDIRVTLDKKMTSTVAAAQPVFRRRMLLEEALEYFEKTGHFGKCNLLRFNNQPKVDIYQCGDFIDLAHNPLVFNTSALENYRLLSYEEGLILQFPDARHPNKFEEFKPQPHLFSIFKDHKTWGRTINLCSVGDLNERIANGGYEELVGIEEAYQEKRMADIADEVARRKNEVKWLMIAGPSSSGKTTFAHRLATQLQVNGLRPVTISVDNFFVDRSKCPLDPDGNYDFEHIEALDLPLLQEVFSRLDCGKEADIPTFRFSDGVREWNGNHLRLEADEVAVVEGIHALNPRMSSALPAQRKFKIYISALTQLNLDRNNRVSTTDNRLLRRILRDHRTRGYCALDTIIRWPSVRRGEDRWIFPWQHEADVAFSSALNYELAVLKPRLEPLLAEVKPWHKQYATARRLQSFLNSFVAAPSSPVPMDSILREFIGGGLLER